MKFIHFLLFLISVPAFAQQTPPPLLPLLTPQPKEYIYTPIIGQSNASEMYYHIGDTRRSPLMALEERLSAYTGKAAVATLDRNVMVKVAVDGSTVDGDYTTASPERIWWYPNARKPGGALHHVMGIMQRDIATLQQSGTVEKVAIVWFQGENDAWAIGGKGAERAKFAARYKQAVTDIFSYIRGQLGGDVEFYMVQIPLVERQAALNSGLNAKAVQEIVEGGKLIQTLQTDLAHSYSDVHLAADASDLQSAFDTGDPKYNADLWHLSGQSFLLLAERLAAYIARDMQQDAINQGVVFQ